MKLSKTSWVIIIIGVFIIVLVGLGTVRFQQFRQENQLNEELTIAQNKLDGIQTEPLSSRQEELEKQLSQTETESKTAKTTLSQPITSITVSDSLLAIAEANSVKVMEISSPGTAGEELEGISLSALSLMAKVEGELTNLVSFITMLNNEFATGVVKSVEIVIPETLSEEKPLANIQMVIYTYQGD